MTDLAVRGNFNTSVLKSYADDPEWQRTWLNLETEDWRSLAVVPTGEECSLELVHALASVAWQQTGASLIVADMRAVALRSLAAVKSELRRRTERGERMLVALRSLDKNPTTATLVRELDKAVICVYLEHSSRADVQKTVRELGPQRCLGSIVVRSNRVSSPKRQVQLHNDSG